jgi:uncharacterized protein YjlB
MLPQTLTARHSLRSASVKSEDCTVTPAVGSVCSVRAEAFSALAGANTVRRKHDILTTPFRGVIKRKRRIKSVCKGDFEPQKRKEETGDKNVVFY